MSLDVRLIELPDRQTLRVLVTTTADDGHRWFHGRDGVIDGATVAKHTEIPREAFLLELSFQDAEMIYPKLREYMERAAAPGDAYALRRDLDHEKTRVDRLLDAVVGQLPS